MARRWAKSPVNRNIFIFQVIFVLYTRPDTQCFSDVAVYENRPKDGARE